MTLLKTAVSLFAISIMTFDGHDYRLDFRAAGRSADYQMLIQAPDEVPSSETGKADLYVNVFNGSERSTVEFSVTDNGEWLPMQKVSEPDPNYIRAVDFDQSLGKHPWKALAKPGNSTHLWKTKLPSAMPPGSYLLRVRTTDMDGKSFESYRVLRVTKG